MAAKPLPSPEVLRQLLRYDPDSGKLFWRERAENMFPEGEGRYTAARSCRIWNTKYAGKEAITAVDPSLGYKKGSVWCGKFYAHRLIWAIQTGAWPEQDIDHINGDRADNRWGNLRAVDRKTNSRNARRRSTNTSGMMGVKWQPGLDKWRAQIMVDGRNIALGCFDDFDEACAARKAAERRYGFHENHGRAA